MDQHDTNTFDGFAAAFLTGDETVIDVAGSPRAWPNIVVRNGRYVAVVQLMGMRDHLCIDVHPFVDGQGARASVFGMETGRRVEGFAADEAGGTSFGMPGTRLVSVLLGEQADTPNRAADYAKLTDWNDRADARARAQRAHREATRRVAGLNAAEAALLTRQAFPTAEVVDFDHWLEGDGTWSVSVRAILDGDGHVVYDGDQVLKQQGDWEIGDEWDEESLVRDQLCAALDLDQDYFPAGACGQARLDLNAHLPGTSAHGDGDGCATYASDFRVTRDSGEEINITALRAGDVFAEYDSLWRVRDIVRAGPDDIHVDLEDVTKEYRP